MAYAGRVCRHSFGVSQEDAQKIKAWLEGEGFTSVQVAKSRARVYFKLHFSSR